MNTLATAYQQFIQEYQLFRKDDAILLAVSGGLDSSVLLHLTVAAGYPVEIAHANFGLRGEESNRDENFVRQLGQEYGLTVHVKHLDARAYADHHRLGIQEAARDLRYQWFHTLLAERTLQCIATAHHGDDNVETMLMNLFKGTGIIGLRGMTARQGNIARPLLFASRLELEAYAKSHGLSFVTDSSNLTDKYTRNYIRLQILPVVEQLYPGAMEQLRNNMKRFHETEQLYREAVDHKLKKLLVAEEGRWKIPVEKLRRTKQLQTLVFELFRPFGFHARQVTELIKFMDAATGSVMQSSTHRLIRHRNWLLLEPNASPDASLMVLEETSTPFSFSGGVLEIHRTGSQTPLPDPHTAYLDANAVQFPLVLRHWKPGDYFYPLGLAKKKKLARFFIDQKLSLPDKEKVWVLESAGRILWVLGQRIDHRARVTPQTTHLVKIHWKPSTT